MKGQELIDWIREHKAETADFVVQYRVDGGCYLSTKEPLLTFDKRGLMIIRNGVIEMDTRTVLL